MTHAMTPDGFGLDRRRFVRSILRGAALGALAAAGGYLGLRTVPPDRCRRWRPCAVCGLRAHCAWSDIAQGPRPREAS